MIFYPTIYALSKRSVPNLHLEKMKIYSIVPTPNFPLNRTIKGHGALSSILYRFILGPVRIARIYLTEFFENPNDGGTIPPPGETACVYTDFVVVRNDKSFRVPPPKKISSIKRLFFFFVGDRGKGKFCRLKAIESGRFD